MCALVELVSHCLLYIDYVTIYFATPLDRMVIDRDDDDFDNFKDGVKFSGTHREYHSCSVFTFQSYYCCGCVINAIANLFLLCFSDHGFEYSGQ